MCECVDDGAGGDLRDGDDGGSHVCAISLRDDGNDDDGVETWQYRRRRIGTVLFMQHFRVRGARVLMRQNNT